VTIDADHWQNRIDQVSVGMTRSKVETLLPPCTRSPLTTAKQGGSQFVRYWVSEDLRVSITYDYTGIPRDAKGKALATTSPHNKVLVLPVLRHSKMPTFEVNSISIEQSPAGDVRRAAPEE